MKKTLLLFTLILFLSSCTLQNNSANYKTGTQGLVMNYVQDNPPSEVVSRSNVPVMIEYSNQGTYGIQNLDFYLTGYDNSILPFSPSNKINKHDLIGKSENNPEGSEINYIKWTSDIKMPPDKSIDSFKQSFNVIACYDYGTIAKPVICVDPQKYDFGVAARCNYNIKGLDSSQGAPIAITEIKQKTTDNEVYLEIHFSNEGKGTPFIAPLGKCLSLGLADVDKIHINKVSTSSGKFTCNPTEVRLENGKGFTLCNSQIKSSNYYETQLTVTATYNYREALPTKEITIVNVN